MRRTAAGQALVETTLALGILILLIFGGINVVQWVMAQYHVGQAARVAAHQAALQGGEDGRGSIAALARTVLAQGLGTRGEHARVTVRCESTPCLRYTAITVEVEYQGRFWVPFGPFRDFRARAAATRAAEVDGTGAGSSGPMDGGTPPPRDDGTLPGLPGGIGGGGGGGIPIPGDPAPVY
jgi:hypothetical protein